MESKPIRFFFSNRASARIVRECKVFFVLFLILIWSVGLGYRRRTQETAQEKIKLTKNLISQKLDQAEQVAFLNMPSALSLIADSKVEVNKLKKELGVKSKGLGGLEKMITDTENKIQAARRFYNGNVRDFNTKIQVFPTNLIAGILSFKQYEFFEADEAEKKNVQVKF